MKVKCKIDRNKKINYTSYYEDRNTVVDQNEVDKVNFIYYINNTDVVMSVDPVVEYLFKIYDMKKLKYDIIVQYYMNKTEVKNVIEGYERIFPFNLSQVLEQGKYEESYFNNLITAGRLFYSLELKEFQTDRINFKNYMGSLSLTNSFKEKQVDNQQYYWVLIIIPAIFILIWIIIYCRKRRRVILNISTDYKIMK